MSYCRWSSDGFRCDVYAYASCEGGVTVHLAHSRQRRWYNALHQLQSWAFCRMVKDSREDGRTPRLMLALTVFMGRLTWLAHKWGVPHWATHYAIPLEVPEDRYGLGYSEAALWLTELRARGFIVPQYAIDGLIEDLAAEVAEAVQTFAASPPAAHPLSAEPIKQGTP